ncbi:EAL domain-containing protein [Lactococcus formosensis]|uniref:EAL domain-containing protein n=1 Tax=Lactococcus formosensis TaxID=1281486 RepID=UPI001FD5D6D6|nr:EAL domain-containing protein [Lactococcus formosensis]
MTQDNIVEMLCNICFFRQKIFTWSKCGQEEYELLLRGKIKGKYIFPEQLFEEVMVNQEFHTLYIRKISKILHELCEKDNAIYSLNIDYQELFYPETIEFLKAFKYDDFLLGINSLGSLIVLVPFITRIKLSVLEIKDFVESEKLFDYLLSIEAIVKQFEKEIVIEGIEDKGLLQSFPKEWKQQSYYYSLPHKFY